MVKLGVWSAACRAQRGPVNGASSDVTLLSAFQVPFDTITFELILETPL
jgi:hypothetical protein